MKKWCFAILLTIISAGCATTQLSALQRRTLESRDLEGKYDDAFKATMQVLQDEGYIINNADYKSGVIQGETAFKQNFLGVMRNSEVTATLEQFGENTVKERISFVKKVKSSSQYGTQEDSTRVEDPELFQRIYDNIQKEMFVRKNLSR
ncbi:MAG: hypothetical protein ACYS6W_03850 [Planctomycetota bacterium]|jgi:hypothetical protein